MSVNFDINTVGLVRKNSKSQSVKIFACKRPIYFIHRSIDAKNKELFHILPGMLTRPLLCSVSGDSHRTVANLMLVGAAGYLLSFLPRHVFTPLLPSLESAQAALLADRCANTASETVFELVTLS